jgi:hypothetical protein
MSNRLIQVNPDIHSKTSLFALPGWFGRCSPYLLLILAPSQYRAAATSRSCTAPHSAHVHSLTDSDNFGPTAPQSGHTPVDRVKAGSVNHCRPAHSDL